MTPPKILVDEVIVLLVKAWAVERSAKVIVPAGRVALVAELIVKVKPPVPDKAKLEAKAKVPVVQVGAPVPPDKRAWLVEPAALKA